MAGTDELFCFMTFGVALLGAKGGGYCAGYFAPSGLLGMDLTQQAVTLIQTMKINTTLIKKNFIYSALNRLIKILHSGSEHSNLKKT
jgi:hypothetical protein